MVESDILLNSNSFHFHIAVAHGVNSSLVLSAHRSIGGCKLVDGEWLFAVENPLHAAHWEDCLRHGGVGFENPIVVHKGAEDRCWQYDS